MIPRRGSRLTAIMLALAAFSMLLVIQGCSGAQTAGQAPATGSAGAGTAQAGSATYSIKVTEGGSVLGQISLDDIKQLPSVKITAEGKEEEGPTLLSVLQRAGVTDFQRVTVTGMQRGRTHSASLPLDRAKVTDSVILSINQRGQTRMISPDIPGEAWIIDVSELEVEK